MIVAGQRLPIVIATKPVDFRRGHDGLAATVQNELGLDPHSGVTVVFRSKRGDRLKILVWDGTGLVLIYKRLEVSNFVWPQIQDGIMHMSRAQYEALFEGLDWRRMVAKPVVAPAHLLENSWPTERLLAQVAVAKFCDFTPLNRQAVAMARNGLPMDRSVLSDWMGRTGALIEPVVEHMASVLLKGSTRLYVDETTAPVLDPGRGKTKTGYFWAVLRDDRGWNGPAPPGVVFHYRPGRSGEYAAEILDGFNGTIQVDAYGGYTALGTSKRTGGKPLKLAYCWAHGRRALIKAQPKSGSPIIDEALLRIAAIYRVEADIRGLPPDDRRAVRQERSRPLVDEFFAWLIAQAGRVSRKSDLGKALAYMVRRQEGFRLFLENGHVDMDSNLVENAIRSPAMTRRNALFAGHDAGARSWSRFASLIGTCRMNGVEPYAYLVDLFTKLACGHLDKDIDALMPWAYAAKSEDVSSSVTP